MNIIARRSILYYSNEYPLAKIALQVWYKSIIEASFKNVNELKAFLVIQVLLQMVE